MFHVQVGPPGGKIHLYSGKYWPEPKEVMELSVMMVGASVQRCKLKQWMLARSLMNKVIQREQGKKGGHGRISKKISHGAKFFRRKEGENQSVVRIQRDHQDI